MVGILWYFDLCDGYPAVIFFSVFLPLYSALTSTNDIFVSNTVRTAVFQLSERPVEKLLCLC